MKDKPNINVCVCTYLRTAHLKKCLVSLVNQNTLRDASYCITVIDNDENRSSESVVNHLQAQSEIPIQYMCEKNRGIPFARNRALEESLKFNFDYIAFIDDDERASCDWLSTIYTYLRSYSACVVIHGRVITKFPEDTPQHMREIFHTRKERPTGTQLQTCATNNVIFSTNILRKFNLRFDSSSPLAGGTDTKFFFELNQRGILIYECAEAVVYETVFPNRLKISWIMRRKYRAGITTAWRRIIRGHSRFSLILISLSSVFLHAVLSSFFTVFLRWKQRDKQLLKIARNLGILSGVFGYKIDSYKTVDY